ncbi:MAG: PLP-dependent aspartate aminotransferase family protein [Gemmatimonadales bacterium]|nr:PLP-dependent aspartate aminotransferase family protein [Gemmatimonadales bacterium]
MSSDPWLACDALQKDPYGSHEPPIYQTSTFVFDSTADAAAIFSGGKPGFVYTRLGNPTIAAWEKRLAELESAGTGLDAAALAFSSGMGAVSAAVLACVEQRDHVVAVQPLYGGTAELFRDLLPRYGVAVTQLACGDLAGLEAAAREPRTKVVYVESPANPTLDIIDIRHAAGVAHAAGARLIVDNTFATPIFQQPLALGADLVVQSTSKFLGGHGTVIGGGVIGTDRDLLAGPVSMMRKLIGSVPSPHDAWLLYQGSKTLALRVERMAQTARRLAAELAQHGGVMWVRYPGLADDPGHEVASRQMSGFGSVIAFGIRGGMEAGARFMDELKVAKRAVSLGCTDTLVEHPASMTHVHLTPEERAAGGITDDLIRVSVGLEPVESLVSDLTEALERASPPIRAAAARSPSRRDGSRRAPQPRT